MPDYRIHMKPITALFLSLFLLVCLSLSAQENGKARTIILTDIEADPDDTQSLVRLLLYANQIEIKGLVATTSCWLTSSIHPGALKRS